MRSPLNQPGSQKNVAGFTLVELLVVVLILVVLSAVAVPIFLGQKSFAERSAANSSVAAISHTIANGFAVKASTLPALVGTVVTYSDGIGASQSVDASGAIVTIVDATDWCVQKGGGATTFFQNQSMSSPGVGVC